MQVPKGYIFKCFLIFHISIPVAKKYTFLQNAPNMSDTTLIQGGLSMRKSSDLTGKQFGKLTVLEKTNRQEDRYWVWRCRCDCGREILVNTKRLTRGTVSHCGCGKVSKLTPGPIPGRPGRKETRNDH